MSIGAIIKGFIFDLLSNYKDRNDAKSNMSYWFWDGNTFSYIDKNGYIGVMSDYPHGQLPLQSKVSVRCNIEGVIYWNDLVCFGSDPLSFKLKSTLNGYTHIVVTEYSPPDFDGICKFKGFLNGEGGDYPFNGHIHSIVKDK